MTLPTFLHSLRRPHATKHVMIGAALLLLGVGGAGAAGMDGMDHAGRTGGFAFGAPGKAGQADRVVKITMKDLSFQPSSLTVNAGETIRFVVTNKSEIEHEFALGDTVTQVAHRKEMAEMFEKGNAMHYADDPNAISLKPGQTAELTWKFVRTSDLEFDCNVPGHYEAGMKGIIAITR